MSNCNTCNKCNLVIINGAQNYEIIFGMRGDIDYSILLFCDARCFHNFVNNDLSNILDAIFCAECKTRLVEPDHIYKIADDSHMQICILLCSNVCKINYISKNL
jgi:hypothetical protein